MGWIQRLEKKFGRYAIKNLMYYLMALYVIGYLVISFAPGFYVQYLSMNPAAIMHGQVWRLVTFIMFPPSTSLLYFVLYLYIYYMLGSTLERVWGSFTFNLYILIGIIGHILGAMVVYWLFKINVGYMYSLTYLNMSLFMAFAATFPDAQVLLFFVIPVKAKWFAILDAVYFLYNIIRGNATTRVVAILSILNFLLFFVSMYGKSFANKASNKARQHDFNQKVKRGADYARNHTGSGAGSVKNGPVRHRCAVCGITDVDDPTMEFRYCSQCNGSYEYCLDHLFTHKHVTLESDDL